MTRKSYLLFLALVVTFFPASAWGSPIRRSGTGEVVAQLGQEEQVVPAAYTPAEEMKSIRTGEGDTVWINLKSVPLQDVLHMIAEKTGRRFIPKPDVKDLPITAYLPGVALDIGLEALFAAHDLELTEFASGIVLVSKKGERLEAAEPLLKTELFRLKHKDAADMKEALEPLLTDVGKISVVKQSGFTGWGFGEEEERRGSGKGATFAPRQRVDGSYRKQVGSQLLIISDTPENLALLKSIIEQIDVMPKQVLITARIVEVSRDKLRDIGFEWATERLGHRLMFRGETIGSMVTPGNFGPEADVRGTFPFDAGGSFLLQKIGGHEFEVLIHALEEEADANVLSAPRVLVLDNQEAVILVGTRFPILQTDVTGTEFAQVTTTLDYYENIGIQLNVVPQIQDEKYINMIIHPEVSDRTGTMEARGTGDIVLAEYPIIETRQTETQVLIEDGQTIVMGGLFKDRQTENVIGVPLLRSIPLIGPLFQRTTRDTEKVELVIFLSATIVSEPAQATEENVPPIEQGYLKRRVSAFEQAEESQGQGSDLEEPATGEQ